MSQNQITPDTIISRSETVFFNRFNDDVVMMDIEKGTYYGLESVAAEIWKLVKEPISVNSLCEKLTAEYNIAPEQCRQDVTVFLQELLNRNVIKVLT